MALRASAVDEDSAAASFARQHLTLLNVPSTDAVPSALRDIWWSANSDSAIAYRQRVGLFTRPSVGVVVQELLKVDVAGVMFTRDPVSGADERVIEASWGLGEAVVAGRVIPDRFRISRSGVVLERAAGVKKIAVRNAPNGGTVEEDVAPELVEKLCLDDRQLVQRNDLAKRRKDVYGPAGDVEWAFAGGALYLLQCRAVTRGAGSAAEEPSQPVPRGVDPCPALFRPGQTWLERIARLFKERRFSAGETIAKEGAGGASFFVISSERRRSRTKTRRSGRLARPNISAKSR